MDALGESSTLSRRNRLAIGSEGLLNDARETGGAVTLAIDGQSLVATNHTNGPQNFQIADLNGASVAMPDLETIALLVLSREPAFIRPSFRLCSYHW